MKAFEDMATTFLTLYTVPDEASNELCWKGSCTIIQVA